MQVYLHKIHTNTNQKLNNLNIKFITVSKTLQKHCLNLTHACVCWSDKTFFPPILGDTCDPAILEIYTCLCAPPYLVWEQCSCPVSGGNTWTRSIAYCRTLIMIQWSSWAFGWRFTSPLLLQESAYESVCMCQGVCTQVIALHILPERIGKWGLTEDRHGKTTGRVPYWNLLYGLPSQKWPLRQPEISFCGSCGLWSCTAATTQFNNAHFEFYLWTKGKVLEQGVWTDQGPVLLDEHRVDKGKKGAKTTPRWLIMLLQRVHLSPIGYAFQAFCVVVSSVIYFPLRETSHFHLLPHQATRKFVSDSDAVWASKVLP